MKKLLAITLMVLLTSSAFSQTKAIDKKISTLTQADRDTLLLDIACYLRELEYRADFYDKYKLYPTENLYTFLKLNTQTGEIDQLQWSLDEKEEGSVSINEENLSYLSKGAGQFELYPTKNIYQFILLDKIFGRTWHVQWGMESSKRWIRRIR